MTPRGLLARRCWSRLPRGWQSTSSWSLPPSSPSFTALARSSRKPSYFGSHNTAGTILSRSLHTWADVSPRELASLEDRLWQSVGAKVVEPTLQKDLGSLKWLDRRIEVLANAAKLTVRLPTLLYPSKDELLKQVQTIASQEVQDWNSQQADKLDHAQIDVEMVAAKPVPAMSKYVENHEELLKQLGPGLVNVSQYLAVYSCKVGFSRVCKSKLSSFCV